MSSTQPLDRFTALPDDKTLAATVLALEEHGFGVDIVDDLDAARKTVLARIPQGSSVMTNTSVTLQAPASPTRSTTADRTSQPATRCSHSTSQPKRRK